MHRPFQAIGVAPPLKLTEAPPSTTLACPTPPPTYPPLRICTRPLVQTSHMTPAQAGHYSGRPTVLAGTTMAVSGW